MASLIKNQILKHLSKFAKNLSADKINVSTLKGEGELNNLELNEEVLMDLLELPFWIRLTKAICNRVTCKIIWTKLKSVPICLSLDEVLVEMETCEELRKQNSVSSMPSYSSGGKYGFYDKVIDGITVTVNNIVINFKSPAFNASVQLSRICLDSRMPTWQKSDLRMTRLKEPERGQLLIFKQLEWQTLRVEAMATSLQEQFSTPLRLITNQARCRITIKKNLSDCSIVGSRLVLILDDLLWVLTDSQLKAALHFANSLSGLIQRATELSQKTKAVRKLESLPGSSSQSGPGQAQRQQHPNRHQSVALSRVFSVHDVVETSYHLYSTQIDLHLCDEINPNEMHLSHPGLLEGGAMQVTFQNLAIDYYPYHLASGDRKHWIRYKDSSTSRAGWVSSLLANFRQRLTELTQGETSRLHTPVYRTHPQSTPSGVQDQRRGAPLQTKSILNTYMNRLMSMCFVVRVDDFTVYQVSTTSGSSKGMPQKFISSDKTRLLLPSDMTAVHLEITQYYYPGDNSISVPSPHMHVHLNPLQITFEPLTLLWVNAFSLTLQKTQAMLQQSQSQMSPMDIRIEGLLPRVVIPEKKEHANQPDRPKQMQIQISRLIITNSRVGENCGRIELGSCLETLQQGELFFASSFPSCPGDFQPVISEFVQHSLSQDRQMASTSTEEEPDGPVRRPSKDNADSVKELFVKIKQDLLWTEMKNIWCVSMDPVWVDFAGVESNKQRPIPFVDAIPLTLWIYQNPLQKVKSEIGCLSQERPSKKLLKEFYQDNEVNKNLDKMTDQGKALKANIHILAHVQSLINVQINHYQYLFVLRILEMLGDLTKRLATDTCFINGKEMIEVSSSCIAAFFPEFHVSFVMPISSLELASKFPGTELDENTSVKSNDSIPTDLSQTPEADKQYSFSVLKESSSDNKALKDVNDKEGSITGSIAKSCSDSLLDAHSVNNVSPNDTSPVLVRSQETLPSGKIIEEISSSLTGPISSGYNTLPLTKSSRAVPSSMSTEWSNLDKVPDNLTRTFITGSSAVKKGFSNIMSSIDSAISASRNSPQGLQDRLELSPEEPPAFDEWETMSMKSDMSSDSDQFLMVHLENQSSRLEDTLFNIQESGPAKVERANEMKEESPSEPSSASVKRLDLVSVLTVCLGKVEYVQLSQGVNSAVCFQSNQLATEEHGSMTWDEFQAKFSARSRNWKETFANHSLSPCEIKFRMDSYPDPHDDSPSAKDLSVITAILKKISLSLSMSSVTGFTDLIEDEIILTPTPLYVSLNHITLHMQEDRPSQNTTSPGSVPLDVIIPNMIIHRNTSGVFEIHPVCKETNEKFLSTLSEPVSKTHPCSFTTYLSEIDKLKNGDISKELVENELSSFPAKASFLSQDIGASSRHAQSLIEENKQLLLQLNTIEVLQKENDQLRDQLNVAVTRADCALERLTEVEDEVLHLREEKRTLLATRQLLQDEVLALEKQQRSRFPDQNATG